MTEASKPPHHSNNKEFTLRAIFLGLILSAVMCAANTYLGLYAGMTVSASIPAAVISMAILRGLLKHGSILENNIVQTMASAGESLAAGIIFTVPALILTGVWTEFKLMETTLIALTGGLLGIIFMIPLRRVLIIEEKELTYPEGVACSKVLQAGEAGGTGFVSILWGMLIGGFFKLFTSGFSIFKGTVEAATAFKSKVFYGGMDASVALLAVGYIVNLEVASLVFMGGFFAWNIVMPFLDVSHLQDKETLDIAWELWSTQIRYLGVGTMIVGGVWSIFSVRKGIMGGLQGLKFRSESNSDTKDHRNQDLNPKTIGIVLLLNIVFVFILYNFLTANFQLSFITTVIMIIASFFFVAVSSYIVGLVGSSNNPVSGMTICVLLGTAGLLIVFGMQGDSAILATLGVAGVVCCAACSAGDISQDLKTGYIVGATPKYQQIAQIIAVVLPAIIIAPILSLLHNAYTIGSEDLIAPQATLFASITQGFFSEGNIPVNMIELGILLGIVIVIADLCLKYAKSPFRLHIMPLAVGIYLPVAMAVPIFIGGLIRFLTSRSNHDGNTGILLSSGLIAGEAVMGILLAGCLTLGWDLTIPLPEGMVISLLKSCITVFAFLVVMTVLSYSSIKQQKQPDKSDN